MIVEGGLKPRPRPIILSIPPCLLKTHSSDGPSAKGTGAHSPILAEPGREPPVFPTTGSSRAWTNEAFPRKNRNERTVRNWRRRIENKLMGNDLPAQQWLTPKMTSAIK
jgi:hypothetical protein